MGSLLGRYSSLTTNRIGIPASPLSKTWLHNPTDTESIRLLPEPIETHASVEWIHDHVVSIEPDQGMIATKNSRRTVDHIVLATGTRAKTLAIDGLPADQVHVIRTLSDAIHLHEALDTAHDIAIIGAGFLAFELATASTIQNVQSGSWPKGFERYKSLSKRQTVFSMRHPRRSAIGNAIERYDQGSASLITNHGPVQQA